MLTYINCIIMLCFIVSIFFINLKFMYLNKNFLNTCVVVFIMIIGFHKSYAQEQGKLDAIFIAKEYSNSIVKILLYDSIAEKKLPGSGYLGRGSGFIVTEDGYIFTNRHVIDYCMEYMQYQYFSPSDKKIYEEIDNYDASYINDPEYIKINYVRRATPIIQVYSDKTGSTFKLYLAKLVAVDTENFDGAILKIVSELSGQPITEKFHPIPIGNSEETSQGEDLCVFGFPAQYENAGFDLSLQDQSTLTFGKHSGFDFVFNPQYGYIKTDASVNSGNSGGPVFNTSNKVIGIATATGTKTNIGLIGGINAMYNLASVQQSILDDLAKIGLTPPVRKPLKNTTLLFAKQLLPTAETLKKTNKLKKNERKFKGGKTYVKFSYSLSQNNKYTTEKNGNDAELAGLTVNYKTLDVKPKKEYCLEFGHLFTLARISNNSKISLDAASSFNYGTLDYSNANIYRDSAIGSRITYDSDASFARFGQRLGLTYSYLLLQKFPIDFYYKFTGAMEPGSQIGSFRDTAQTYKQEIDAKSGRTFLHSIGLNFRHDFYFIGMEYSFGNTEMHYSLPYIQNDQGQHYYNSVKISGENNIRSLKITLGFMFGGKNKWKGLLIKKYKANL